MSIELPPAEEPRMDVAALFGALWARALRIVIVTALLLAVTFVTLMFAPKLYESSASLLVEDRGTTSTGGITMDALISSQIEMIKSLDTLLAVIDSQNLRSVPEFSGAAALQNLSDRLTVIREGGPAISIYVRSGEPQLAASIANAIAAEHVTRRGGQVLADTAETAAGLQQQIEQLRRKVQQADQAVADYRAANGTTLPDQQIADIDRQITDAEGRRSSAEQRATSIRELIKAGQPVEGIDDVRSGLVVQSLMQSRATLQGTLAEKRATLLPAHPTVRALNAQIAQLDAQIVGEARRIADGLAAQATVEAGIIASLNDDLARARLATSTQSPDSAELDSVAGEAKAQRELLDASLAKYRDASTRLDAGAAVPDVRITTAATPSAVPVSPRGVAILGAVGIGALALQIAAVLFGEMRSGRTVSDRRTSRETEPEMAVALQFEDPSEMADADRTADEIAAELEADMADMADMPEPEFAAVPRSVPAPAASQEGPGLEMLVADLTLGRARIVLLAGISEARDAAVVADTLVGEALSKGLSVCRIDAGSGRPSALPGLTDLCADQVSFGDVVHKVREGLAEVPWGQMATIDRRSMRPVTLVEALADIYEVVIVSTGRIGLNSSLPIFAGLHGRLVMVRQAATPGGLVEAVMADAASIGFDSVESVMVPEPQSAVA